MTISSQDKYRRLLDLIKGYGSDRVGVACSGGVDSTLLAFACCDAIGAERVVVCFAESCLLSEKLRDGIEGFIRDELPPGITFIKVRIDSLGDKAFTRNDSSRCYICKKRIYTALFSHLTEFGIQRLCDGTNCDDLKKDRPGLRAIRELGVVTPLVDAGFHKSDVRAMAATLGLGNADLPSNSCLATRIESLQPITDRALREIERHECFLIDRGYEGCRVRPRVTMVLIEVQGKDLNRLIKPEERSKIISYFQQNGYKSILIDICERSR